MRPLLLERILEQRADDPSRVILNCVEHGSRGDPRIRTVSLDRLVVQGRECARKLRSVGVSTKDRVLLCLPNSELFAHWFVGAMWLGAVPVPLPSLSAFGTKGMLLERVRGVITDCKPTALIADAGTARYLISFGENLTGREALINAEDRWVASDEFSVPPEPYGFAPNDTAFIQYTSGSTGRPKGVVVTQENLAENLCASAEAMNLTSADVMVSWLPLYHDMGLIGGLLLGLYSGFPTFLLQPIAFMSRPSVWLRALSQYRGTLTVAPNFAYGLCLRKVKDEELTDLDLSAWRLAFNGAEPVDPGIAVQFGERFAKYKLRANSMFPVYGLAEATLSVAFPAPGEPVHIDRVERMALIANNEARPVLNGGEREAMSIVSVGRAMPGHQIEIRDPENSNLCPDRHVGEIIVRGPSVTPCYFGEEKSDPRESLRTGDLGYIADSRLYVVDRIKDLVIIAGRSYFPSDIERALSAVAEVRRGRVVAFGVPDAESGTEALVIAAETTVKQSSKLARIQADVRTVLAETFGLTPRVVLTLEPGTLPRTSSGKIMRRNTRNAFLANELGPPKQSAFERLRNVVRRLAAAISAG